MECSVPEVCSSEEEDVVSVVILFIVMCNYSFFLPQMTKLISRRTLQYPYQVNEFVSVKGPEGWGYVCFDSLNARSANVVCRSTKKQFGTRTRAVVFPQGKHVLYNGTFNCTGSETTLRDCNIALQETDKCKNYDKYVAVVDCSSGRPAGRRDLLLGYLSKCRGNGTIHPLSSLLSPVLSLLLWSFNLVL